MNHLENIYQAARRKDAKEVQRLLSLGLFSYRLAQAYCETKHAAAASDFIRSQARCKCGNIVSQWDGGKPTCNGCRLREAMSRIEFGPNVKVTIHKASNIA